MPAGETPRLGTLAPLALEMTTGRAWPSQAGVSGTQKSTKGRQSDVMMPPNRKTIVSSTMALLAVEARTRPSRVKIRVYESVLDRYGLTDSEVAFVGDDLPEVRDWRWE